MKEKKNKQISENLVHFETFEETVIRDSSPEKEAIKKTIKKKYGLRKLKQIISLVSAFAVLVSAFFLGKRGFESYLAYTQEKKGCRIRYSKRRHKRIRKHDRRRGVGLSL